MTDPIPLLDRLDADHRKLVESIPEGLLDPSDLMQLREKSDVLLTAAAARHVPIETVRIEDDVMPGAGDRPDLKVRFYIPEGITTPAPVFLYIHGGGYVSTLMRHYDAQCSAIAEGTGLIVASIDYRLAPESPYPGPVEDSYAALAWLHAIAAERGFDPARIGVGGTSAGAGLAAAVTLLARDRGDYPVPYQYLEAPMVDHRNVTPSSHAITDYRVWHRALNQACWAAYLGADHLETPQEPYASPALAPDLAGLPPTYLCVSAFDLFLDETIEFAQRLLRAGVSVQLNLYEMGFHGSPRVLPSSPVSARWKADSHAALRRLSGQSPAHA